MGQVWAAVGEGHVVSWEDSPADVLVIYTLFQRPPSFCHLMFRAVCLRWSEPTSLRPDSRSFSWSSFLTSSLSPLLHSASRCIYLLSSL